MIIDNYFKRPIFWDYFIGLILAVTAHVLFYYDFLILPESDESVSLTSDITNISLTMSGFILTILTVLITFKSSLKISKIELDSDESVFDLFFATGLYHETVKHLKNCIKSILVIAILGFSIKLLCPIKLKQFIFYFNVFGLTGIILTLFRCMLILGKVMDLQKESDKTQ